jgi:sugar-specific transcriptional regulator TrmB
LSLERVLRILESFGLTRSDAKAYIYLAKNGPKKKEDITVATKLTKNQINLTLKNLLKKGLIKTNFECFEVFSALMFEQLLDKMIAFKDEEAQVTKQTRKELLASWQSIIQDKNKPTHNKPPADTHKN